MYGQRYFGGLIFIQTFVLIFSFNFIKFKISHILQRELQSYL